MTSNEQFNERQFTPEGLLEGLLTTAAPFKTVGVEFVETTESLAAKIVDVFDETFGIHEIDHCLLYPRRNKQGQVVDFDAVLYFNTAKGGNNKTIKRVGDNQNSRRQDGRTNLMALVGQRTQSGAFDISDEFKKAIAPYAELDNNGNIVVFADEHRKEIAMVEANFFKLLAMLLDIKSTDSYDFTVADCTPVNNREDCLNFRLIIVKEILPDNRRRNKSGINYDAMDRKRIQKRRYN